MNNLCEWLLKRFHTFDFHFRFHTSCNFVCIFSLLQFRSKKIYDQFKEALEERERKGQFAEITFIGIKSALVKSHKKIESSLEVTVDFVSEIITCVKDKEKKIISGDSEKIKTIYDTWTFSRDISSNNPNWLLVDTLN